jgi:hypothetical protein
MFFLCLRSVLPFIGGLLVWPLQAGATPIASSATITYLEAASTGPTFGAPVFNADGSLLSAGSGHPTFGVQLAPQQVAASANIFFPPNPYPALLSFAVPGAIGTGTAFAGGAAGVTAFNFGQSVESALFWAPFALGVTAAPGYAIVDSPAHVVVQNDLSFAQLGYALSLLQVIMTVPHGAPGYVAVSLTATVGGNPMAPIVLATDGVGPLPDVATAGISAGLFFLGLDPFFGLDYFFAFGFSVSPLLTVQSGAQLTFDATITGVADPGSSFFDVFVEPNLPPLDAPILVQISSGVPEPGTLVLFVVAAIGGLAARGRLRRLPR